jgi:hypothetical protein
MELAAAVEALRFDTAAGSDPAVSDADLEAVLARCQLADASGLAPDHDDWAGAYDFDLAQAMVFERKAALLANQVTFSADGSKFDLNARAERFRGMARDARNRRMASYAGDLSGIDVEDDDAL